MENYPNSTDLPVLLIYNIDPSWPVEDIQNSLNESRLLASALAEVGHCVEEVCVQSADLQGSLSNFLPRDYVIFNWCEELPGIRHSEYYVPDILDHMGFSYTGANAQALKLSQDKRRVKKLLQLQGVPTPNWRVFNSAQSAHWERYPAIVKPAFEHCGLGIARESVIESDEALARRIQYVLEELQQPAIIEDFIDGREFHIGVVGNGLLTALPPAEIDYSPFNDIHDRLCTFESNFDRSSLAYKLTTPKLPAGLTDDELKRLEDIVLAAYRATSCRDYARMDVRLQNGVFYLLDVNHNADLCADNSLVRAAGMLGLSYGQLGSLLVNLAAERHPVFGLDHLKKQFTNPSTDVNDQTYNVLWDL